MSTLAIDTSDSASRGRPSLALRYADLALLIAALPLFIVADWPLLGYAVAAGAWLAQHVVLAFAERRAKLALGRRDRRLALGIVGGATLARLWLVTAAILVVGLVADRQDGLAAAVLTLALVTVHLGALGFTKFLYPEDGR